MSDIVKWGLLAAGIAAIIAVVLSLPFVEFINFSEFNNGVTAIVDVSRYYLTQARGLINNFLTPFGRTLLTGIIYYLFGRWAINIGVKITAWVYHFILK